MRGLRDFSTALMVLGEVAPDRLTVSQAVFFMFTGLADLAGHPRTFTEVRDAVGPAIGKSLHTTYKALLDESRNRGGTRDAGAGWLTRELDATDNRRKYLRLTQKGRAVLRELDAALTMRKDA